MQGVTETQVEGCYPYCLRKMVTPHPTAPRGGGEGRRSFACVIFLFVTKGKFHIPRNSPQKEKMTHGSQPTPRRMRVTEPLRNRDRAAHRPRKGSVLPARDRASSDPASLEGQAGI